MRQLSISLLVLLSSATICDDCFAASAASNLRSARLEDRLQSAEALGAARDSSAVQPLLDALKTEKVTAVRVYMVRALGLIGDKSAMPALMKIAQSDPEIGTRSMALSAISRIGDPAAIDQLEKWTTDPAQHPDIRAYCVTIATHHKGEKAMATLQKAALDPSPAVRAAAIQSAAAIHGRPEIKQMIESAQNDHDSSVKSAAQAIAKRKALGKEPW